MSERRELVAREVFALDADWRREYWDQFRRDFARQAQAYYDTADRILAIVREDAMEVTQHTHADVRERVARECVEEAERLGRWYGDGYAKARSLLREAAALLLTPRGEGEAAAMSANLARALAAMQAAWIEWRRGRGADAAMQWIENTLIGPGLIPGDDESDAQAFFDRAIAEIENHQIRWEDLVFGPIVEAYNEAHDAGREDGRRDAAAEISRLTRELEAARAENRRLREALERVADGGCERFYGTDCWQMGMDPHAEDYADRVCDPCFARRALAADTEVSDDE